MGLEVGKDITNIRSLKDLAKNISEKFREGEEVKAGKGKVGQIEGAPQFQAEDILLGKKKHPVFESMKEVAKYLQDWAGQKKNQLFRHGQEKTQGTYQQGVGGVGACEPRL